MTVQEQKPKGKRSKYQYDTSERCFKLFKESIKSPDTAYYWTNALNIYMAHRKARKYSDLLKGNPKKVQADLMEFVQHRKTKVRAQSVGVQLTGIKHFFWINDFDSINWDKVRAFIGERVKAVQDVPYTHDQIRDLCKHAKNRLRICILSEAQGGPRIGAIPTINKGDLSRVSRTKPDGTNEDMGFYRAHIYPGTEQAYITFFGPEASKEIDEYFSYRERCGEELNDNSPLIREEFDPKDEFQVEHPRRISKKTLAREIANVAVIAGVRPANKGGGPHNRHKVMLTHGLRKFFKKQCRRAGIDPINLEYLIGHKHGSPEFGVTSLMMTYDPAIEDELLKEYMKAIDNLTIDPANRLTKQVKELEVKAKKADQVDVLERAFADSKLETQAIMKRLQEQESTNKQLTETVAILLAAEKERKALEMHKDELLKKHEKDVSN